MSNQRKRFLIAAMAALTLSTGACSRKDSDACSMLADTICADGSVACERVTPWLESQLTGPDNKPLSPDDRVMGCSMILGDKDALVGFREAAKSALK